MTDLMTLDQWKAFEKEIHERFQLNAAATDAKGVRITDYANWGNSLCKRIKTDPKGLAAICAPTGQYCVKRMTEGGVSFIEECEAGMLKIVVPVRVNGELMGCIGGCGALEDDGELDAFMVAKAMEVEEGEIEPLASQVPYMSRNRAEEAVAWIEARLEELIPS